MGLTENIIRNLTKDELRYISREVLADRDSQVSMLFGLMEDFGDDEEKVASRFRRAAPKGNLAVVRNQLQHILLMGLGEMHSDRYTFAEVNAMILQIQIFIDKSAFDVVKKLLDRALKIAEENELFPQVVRLIEMKIQLCRGSLDMERGNLENILNDYKVALSSFTNYTSYHCIVEEIGLHTNHTNMMRNEQAKKNWENIMHLELMKDAGQALSKRARTKYWIIRAHYYFTYMDYDRAKTCFLEIVSLCEENKFIKEAHSTNYFWAYSQLAHIAYYQRDMVMMRRALDTIKNAEKDSVATEVSAFLTYAVYSMGYYDLTNDPASVKQIADEAYAWLQKWTSKVKPHSAIGLLETCVSVWVELGEYDKAIRVIQEFNGYINTGNKLDAKIGLLFFELIAQIESGNQLMVGDTLQNFNRYLLRHGFKREFEQIMVKFLKIISSYSIHMKAELTTLREQLVHLPDRSIFDQHPVLYQVLMTLIDSRLAGRKYHDYVKFSKASGHG